MLADGFQTLENVESPWDVVWGGSDAEIIIEHDSAPVTLAKSTQGYEHDGYSATEDFTPEQKASLSVLKKRVKEACNVNSKDAIRWAAIDWCFIPGDEDSKGLKFDDLCLALGARPEVVRARIHHQWYLAGVILTKPLHLLSARMPEQYESEAIMCAWENGMHLCREIWRWPSIPLPVLLERSDMEQEEFDATLNKLIAAHLVAIRFGCVFLIGRRAHGRPRNFSWSKSFF